MLDHFTIKATGHYTMLVSRTELERVGTQIVGFCRSTAIEPTEPKDAAPDRAAQQKPSRVSLNRQRIDISLHAATPDVSAPVRSGKPTASVLPF